MLSILYSNCKSSIDCMIFFFCVWYFRVEGGELFDRVASGKFSERITKIVFYQMLVAVTVCGSPFTFSVHIPFSLVSSVSA